MPDNARGRNKDLRALEDVPTWEWPLNTDALLKKVLSDEQAHRDDRILAADLASEIPVINDALADALLAVLNNGGERDELRSRAAISLGPVLELVDTDGFEEPEDLPISERTYREIQDVLHRLYLDATVPQTVRRRIFEASVRAPLDWHSGAIRAAYASEVPDWRLTAVFAMRFVRGFEDQILESLASDRPEIRYEAVCAAGNWGIQAAWKQVSALLTSTETEKHLLLAAFEAAVNIRPAEAGPMLVDYCEADDPDISEAASEAMMMADGLSEDFDEEEDEDSDG